MSHSLPMPYHHRFYQSSKAHFPLRLLVTLHLPFSDVNIQIGWKGMGKFWVWFSDFIISRLPFNVERNVSLQRTFQWSTQYIYKTHFLNPKVLAPDTFVLFNKIQVNYFKWTHLSCRCYFLRKLNMEYSRWAQVKQLINKYILCSYRTQSSNLFFTHSW